MATTLKEYLEKKKPAKIFRPISQYIPEGDCLIFYFKPDSSYAERLDELLTVYRSEENGQITGCEIKGIKCIFKRLGDFGLLSQKKSIDVRIIFGGYRLSAIEPKQEPIEELRQAAEKANAHVDAGEMVLV
jgi:hypothetical protein